MNLQGRVALVTGGGRGIGQAISLRLAREGADVAINYLSNRDAAETTARAVEALGRRARVYQCDVGEDFEAVRHMTDQVAADFGGLDLLVANAGLQAAQASVHDSDVENYRRVFASHFWGSYYCAKAALPHLRERPRGDIIFMSSIQTKDRFPNRMPYVAGKMAVEGLGTALAKEEYTHGVRVNIMRPGITASVMGTETLRRRGITEEFLAAKAPFGRICQPEDVAAAVAFLCSERGSYITGVMIPIDGGGGNWIPPRTTG